MTATQPSLFDPPPAMYSAGTLAGHARGRETSRTAARDLDESLAARQKQVLACLRMWGPLCGDEVASMLRLPVTSVRPRIRELCIAEKVEEVLPRRVSPLTGKKQIAWRAKLGAHAGNDAVESGQLSHTAKSAA